MLKEPRAGWRHNYSHLAEFLPAGETGSAPVPASLLSPRPETQFQASMTHIAERAARAAAHVDVEELSDSVELDGSDAVAGACVRLPSDRPID